MLSGLSVSCDRSGGDLTSPSRATEWHLPGVIWTRGLGDMAHYLEKLSPNLLFKK